MAFVDVMLLWAVVGSTLIAFWRHSKVAGAMFVPYFLWVTFAAALNYSVWQLNPGRLG
jgi:benzodiazapine receptor